MKNYEQAIVKTIGRPCLAAITLLTSLCTAQAQSLGDQLLRGVLQTVQQQVRSAQQPSDGTGQPLPPGMTGNGSSSPSASAATPTAIAPWPTKEAFLAAASRGELFGVVRINDAIDQRFNPVLNSIGSVLAHDYRVPPIPRGQQGCELQYRENVLRLMRAVTARFTSTVSDQGPDFTRPSNTGGLTPEIVVPQVQSAVNCDFEMVGIRQPHPYKQALIQLMGEYGSATQVAVEAERDRRKQAYAQQQAQVQAQVLAQQKAAAEAQAVERAREQARIDAERARIEAEQRRREQIQRNRIAG